MKLNNDIFKLSTGKEIYANCGILGICEYGKKISISGGYDQGINEEYENFTKEERQEIARYVINLWEEWAK